MQNIVGTVYCRCYSIFTLFKAVQNAKTWMHCVQAVGKGEIVVCLLRLLFYGDTNL